MNATSEKGETDFFISLNLHEMKSIWSVVFHFAKREEEEKKNVLKKKFQKEWLKSAKIKQSKWSFLPTECLRWQWYNH